MTANGGFRGVDELAREVRTDLVPAVVDELRERTRRDRERCCRRILVEDGRRELDALCCRRCDREPAQYVRRHPLLATDVIALGDQVKPAAPGRRTD